MSDPASPLVTSSRGVRLAVRVVPKAAASRIVGVVGEGDGGAALKVAVAAPPEDGKANDALLALLAKALRVPRRDLTIAAGASSRRKIVEIAGDPATLAASVRSLYGER